MSRHLRVSSLARQDIRDIFVYTARTFGRQQARKYRTLIEHALADIEKEPTRIGSKEIPEIGEGVRGYRVTLSARSSGTKIKNPRHLVIYIDLGDDSWGVLRILHESMDFGRHIPDNDEFIE